MAEKEAGPSSEQSKTQPGRRALRPRVTALEEQVDCLEGRVSKLEDATGLEHVQPAPEQAGEERPRCPGCRLEIEKPRARRCVWCGFVLAAARGPV